MPKEVVIKNQVITPRQLRRLLKKTCPAKLPVMITGMPGVGKTMIVKEVAKDINATLQILHPVVGDPTDAKGMPWVFIDESTNQPKAVFVPFAELKAMMDAKGLTIVLLDDLGQAPPTVQAAYMQLILGREINGKKISDDVVFIACTNRKEDRAGVSGILEPVKSRFTTIVELIPHHESWDDWAISEGIEPELRAFISMRPCFLEGGPEGWTPTSDMTNSPVGRTIESLNSLVRLDLPADVRQPAYSGAVGSGCATEYLAFERIITNLPDMNVVLNNPKKAQAPGKRDVAFAMMGVFNRRMNKGNIDNIYIYMDLHFSLEMQAVVHFGIDKIHPELVKTKGYVAWSVEHGEDLSN